MLSGHRVPKENPKFLRGNGSGAQAWAGTGARWLLEWAGLHDPLLQQAAQPARI